MQVSINFEIKILQSKKIYVSNCLRKINSQFFIDIVLLVRLIFDALKKAT